MTERLEATLPARIVTDGASSTQEPVQTGRRRLEMQTWSDRL